MMRNVIGAIALGAALSLSVGCARMGTARAENCEPTNDLVLTAQYEQGQRGATSSLTGSIFNNSLRDEYENAQIKVDFYDANGANISSQVFTIRQDFDEGEAEEFDIDFNAPVGARSAQWSLACAERG